ncbi:hypothetical protein RA955_04290 [Geobacillus proteiniphilus]|nr:hypothetical protein [Geobacillus proteiniphilus]WMJ17333.1 hypothetical protein RA955_04290 [Geobacillus proteiniphilus]
MLALMVLAIVLASVLRTFARAEWAWPSAGHAAFRFKAEPMAICGFPFCEGSCRLQTVFFAFAVRFQ